jgi:hypothetical protein
VDGLFEGHLDFETHAIEADDVQRAKGQVGGQENPAAPLRVRAGSNKMQETCGF